MSVPNTISEVVNLWPSRQALADDLCRLMPDHRVSKHMVNKWAETGSIRAIYHQGIVDAAALRALPVSAELLVRLHAPSEDAA